MNTARGFLLPVSGVRRWSMLQSCDQNFIQVLLYSVSGVRNTAGLGRAASYRPTLPGSRDANPSLLKTDSCLRFANPAASSMGAEQVEHEVPLRSPY